VSVAVARGPASLLIVRLGAMGDVIHAFPGVSALRRAFPESRIGWVVEERWAELLCAPETPRSGPRDSTRPLVDYVHTIDTKRWRGALLARKTRGEIGAALREIRRQKYQIAIDFQGSIKSAIIAKLAGSGQVAGMEHPRESPARWFYDHRITTAGTHVIEQDHSLAEVIARGPLAWVSVQFPQDDRTQREITKKLTTIGANFVVISPGAGWGAKQWPGNRYGELAKRLAQRVPVIVNFGPGEQELAAAVERASGGAARPISCTVSELIALMRCATLFIGGDTGPLHLAAALKIPVLALFGPTDPARNGPYGTKSIVLRGSASKNSLSHVPATDPGLLQLTVEQVLDAALQLLEQPSA